MKDINIDVIQSCTEDQKLAYALSDTEDYVKSIEEKFPVITELIKKFSLFAVSLDLPMISKLLKEGKIKPEDTSSEIYKVFYADMITLVHLLDKANSDSEVTANDNKG